MCVDLGLKACESEFQKIIIRPDDLKGEENSELQLTLRALLPQYYLPTGRVLKKELVCSSLTLW